MLLSFLYRYFFVLEDQWQRMSLARQARTFGGRRFGWAVPASMLGTLFLRAYERGEAVYLAMRSRGFNGACAAAPDGFAFQAWDYGFMAVVAAALALVRLTA